jgi:hypothetical protein
LLGILEKQSSAFYKFIGSMVFSRLDVIIQKNVLFGVIVFAFNPPFFFFLLG